VARILIVDDDAELVTLLGEFLEGEGFAVVSAADGERGARAALDERPDLVVLDVMLPALSGFEALRRIRERSAVPVVMLSARGEEVDRVVGLEIGADDYVTKPFSVRELMARVKAVLRRTQAGEASAGPILTGPGDLRLDSERREAWVGETSLNLARLEFDLLLTLLANRDRVQTREHLLEEVWGYDFAGNTRAVDSAVKRLRARLRAADPQADGVQAVRGLGYKFKGNKP